MTKPSNREFWKSQFDSGGNDPGTWFRSAIDLLTSADVLDGFSANYRGEIIDAMRTGRVQEIKNTRHFSARMSADKVSHMLHAMATECLLKALWLKHGGTLAKDGRYIGALAKNEHRLHKFANTLSSKGSIDFTDREIELLEQASYWITSGRYPIQRDFDYLVPIAKPDGTVAPKQSWQGDPFNELKALIEKLKNALGITINFEES